MEREAGGIVQQRRSMSASQDAELIHTLSRSDWVVKARELIPSEAK